MHPQLPAIQAKLPAGYCAVNRRAILAIFYPDNIHPMEALRVMREAGAHGFNYSCGPAMEFPAHPIL